MNLNITLLILAVLTNSSLQCGEGCKCFNSTCDSCKAGYSSKTASFFSFNIVCVKCNDPGCG